MKHVPLSTSKARGTAMLCCSMDRYDCQKLFVIVKVTNPQDFRSMRSVPMQYQGNAKAWMTKVLFTKWVVGLGQQVAVKGQKILLLLDSCNAYCINLRLTNVERLFCPQTAPEPLDMGIAANFRACHKRRVMNTFFAISAPTCQHQACRG